MIRESATLTLRPSLVSSAWMLGVSVLIFLVGVSTIRDHWIAGALCVLFGIGCFITVVAFLRAPRASLSLSAAGFKYGTLLKKHSYRWEDVCHFATIRIGVASFVGFTMSGKTEGDLVIRAKNRRDLGVDRFLPTTYGLTPLELAELLEDWRSRHSRRADASRDRDEGL